MNYSSKKLTKIILLEIIILITIEVIKYVHEKLHNKRQLS